VVTKDSGGAMTAAKLEAARRRGLAVVVIERPPREEVPTVATVAAASAWIRGRAPESARAPAAGGRSASARTAYGSTGAGKPLMGSLPAN